MRKLESSANAIREPTRPHSDHAREPERRSTGFQSAVSQVFNLPRFRRTEGASKVQALADWKSAMQQIENLRYGPDAPFSVEVFCNPPFVFLLYKMSDLQLLQFANR